MGSGGTIATRALGLATVLVAAWLLWSGLYKPLLLALGAFSCELVIYVSFRMHLFEYSVFTLRFGWRLIGFWGWLGKEAVKSSLLVSRIVLSPRLPISPTVTELDAASQHPVDLATLGNSITLTPGTITVSIHKDEFSVYALPREASDSLPGDMEERVARALEGGH